MGICTLAGILLLISAALFLAVAGLPDPWSTHEYEATDYLSKSFNTQAEHDGANSVDIGYLFRVKLEGADEGIYTGGSPFALIIRAYTNHGPDVRWQVVSVEVSSTQGEGYNLNESDGIYSGSNHGLTGFESDGLRMDGLGVWKTAYRLEFDHQRDANLKIVVAIQVEDKNGTLNRTQIERNFSSVQKQGWFKSRM